jgi:tetratricopeptide (TPR) repeat protein
LPDALREYDAALKINFDDADVHHNKAAVYIQQAIQSYPPDMALLDEAQNEIDLALKIKPDLPQAHFSQGVVYMVRGQNQDAIAQFRRFLELDDGTDPEATAAAQSYLTQLGQ